MREIHDLTFYGTLAIAGCFIAWYIGLIVWALANILGAL